MSNKFRRAIDHLTDSSNPEKVISAIQAVEDLFSKEWLIKGDAHRLQVLWARRDALSTSELYSLGKSIIKLSVDNRGWLEANAKEIKKNKDNSHGLLSEIIIIGSLSTDNGVITPCPKSFKLYDYTVDFDTGYKYKVSIKNFDITKHEKEFKKRCEIIRSTFKNHIKNNKLSGRLTVILEHDFLSEELTKEICFFIVFKMNDFGFYPMENLRGGIGFHEINECDKSILVNPSDIVIVIAKHHFNEQRNIIDKINNVNAQLLLDNNESTSLKQLIIRLGSSANIELINKHMNMLADIDHWDQCGFDLYFLFQPQVVVDTKENCTMISTSIKNGGKSFHPLDTNIKNKIENLRMLQMEFGIGTINPQSTPLTLVVNNSPKDLNLTSHYVYQKGDLFIRAVKNKNSFMGNLSKIGPGVKTHLVFNDFTLSPVIYSEEDRLLII
jgi:hypothetical protein